MAILKECVCSNSYTTRTHKSNTRLKRRTNYKSKFIYFRYTITIISNKYSGMAPRVHDWGAGGLKANLTNSCRSMLRFDQLESVNVEVWPTPVGQCWGLTNLSRSMLRFDRLEAVTVEVWPTRILFIKQNISVSWSGFDQLSQQHWGGGGGTPAPLGAIPVNIVWFEHHRKS